MISSVAESGANSCSVESSAVSQNESSNSESTKKTFEDPVTKAVVDNIMGRLPSKKVQVTLHCELCNLEFYSHITLEMHLKGAKHAKRIKSAEIIQALQKEGQTFQSGYTNNLQRCDICQVVVNSTHQLQTHLAGTKHRRKAMKRSAPDSMEELVPPGVPVKKKPPLPESKPVKVPENKPVGFQPDPPLGIRQVANSSFTKSGKFFCETCQVSLNSEIQLHQHATSIKHLDKVMGKQNTAKSRFPGKGNKSAPKMSSSLTVSNPSPAPVVIRGTTSLRDSFIRGETMT